MTTCSPQPSCAFSAQKPANMPGHLAKGRAPLKDKGPNRIHDLSFQRASQRQCADHHLDTKPEKSLHNAAGENEGTNHSRERRPASSQTVHGRPGTALCLWEDPLQRPWSAKLDAFSAAQLAHQWPLEMLSRPTTTESNCIKRDDSCRAHWRLRPASVPVGNRLFRMMRGRAEKTGVNGGSGGGDRTARVMGGCFADNVECEEGWRGEGLEQ
jgi:hypothetical protein